MKFKIVSVLFSFFMNFCFAQADSLKLKNEDLAFELCQIYGFDQGIRDFSLEFDKRQIMPKIDTINFNKIVAFVEKNGFPTRNLLGDKFSIECVSMAAPAVLLHNPHRLVNEKKYFDLFLDEVKKGNMPVEFFATVLDKYYWGQSINKKERRVFYGSPFGKPCIQTKEETNKARIEIGLEPLKDEEFVDCSNEELFVMPKKRI